MTASVSPGRTHTRLGGSAFFTFCSDRRSSLHPDWANSCFSVLSRSSFRSEKLLSRASITSRSRVRNWMETCAAEASRKILMATIASWRVRLITGPEMVRLEDTMLCAVPPVGQFLRDHLFFMVVVQTSTHALKRTHKSWRPKACSMKTGIIGLPQVGKTSLFRILTKAQLSDAAYSNPREAHVGVARVPDERLDRLAALYNPRKLTHASVEYVDVGAIGQEALKESGYIGHLRNVDALAHVVRAFEDDSIPHVGPVDPLRDIRNVEFDLMVSDLGQIEKRLERVEKDLKKMKTADLEKEFDLLKRAKAHVESERPLRELEMSGEDKKRIRGFMFLSEKPILYVLNVSESTELGKGLEAAVGKYKLSEVASRPNAAAAAICGKVEAELSEMSDADAAEFLSSYGLKESGLVRLIR